MRPRISEAVLRRDSRISRGPWFCCRLDTILRGEEDSWTMDFRTFSSTVVTQGLKGTLDPKNRTFCLHVQQLSCLSTPGQDHQNPKTTLHGATALLNLDCRNRVLGLVGEVDACGVSPCRLAAPDLPVRSLSLHCQGTSECFFLSEP